MQCSPVPFRPRSLQGEVAVYEDGDLPAVVGFAGDGQIGGAHHEVQVGDGIVEAVGLQLLLGHVLAALDALGVGLAEGQIVSTPSTAAAMRSS